MASDQDRWRGVLLTRRAELLAEGDIKIDPIRQDDGVTKVDEDAQPLTEMSQVIASKRNQERTHTLARIDQALRRLQEDPDAFGLCGECEEPIGKRMEVMPWVEMCTGCQQERDGDPHPKGRRHLTDFR